MTESILFAFIWTFNETFVDVKELMDSVVIAGGREVGGGEEDIRGINGDGGNKIKQKSKPCARGQSTIQAPSARLLLDPFHVLLCLIEKKKKTEWGKKQSHRDVIKMQQQVLPHKTGFLPSPLILPASFQVFFFLCSRSSSCSTSLPFKQIPIFLFLWNNDSLSHHCKTPGLLQPAYDSTCF